MPSLDRVRLLGSALLPRSFDAYGVATVGAMLTCIAIVLDVGQFCRPLKTSPSPTERVTAVSAAHAAERWSALPSASEDVPQSFKDLLHTASISFDAAPWIPSASRPEQSAAVDSGSVHFATSEAAVQLSADHNASDGMKNDPIVGVWAPDPGTCSARNFRAGDLPTVISTDGAWAGETFCMFTRKKQTDAGWRLVAKCSSPRERWTANVRLSVSDNRLTWTSERGSQVYTRCKPDLLTAQAR
jgi:hypothetical protein